MKSLACMFGRHHWVLRAEHGDEYDACERCGKVLFDGPSRAEAERQRQGFLDSIRGYLKMWRYNFSFLIFIVVFIGITVAIVVFRAHLHPLHGPAPDLP